MPLTRSTSQTKEVLSREWRRISFPKVILVLQLQDDYPSLRYANDDSSYKTATPAHPAQPPKHDYQQGPKVQQARLDGTLLDSIPPLLQEVFGPIPMLIFNNEVTNARSSVQEPSQICLGVLGVEALSSFLL
ncbi:predicted protein [Aspergillus nidulans FGSC A4]|uniref:Uncharacterized protein n=1 Tax=Emericella nidulans (strain FGSC A4 / ATCC 38163 / CBS 112.46 / NRRL 194 / M139) TaxID=227321 RepID=Q5B338_EMENI|nr:hypothetical protein [Aspergillus nidulans FGSC A4]EAA61120.1 predicted protein [Aspergillus nidulans FGSC A4]CBF76219.1 TPA: hypothetical protein ANIA_05042 [Aspergillus nidulans FGSC A4]|eukprot:XP_662646.1 predicted protein [Aspergillus nidulans FGSC A4]